MSVIPRYLLIPLRIGQLAFGAVVAGILAYFLHQLDGAIDSSLLARWVYVEVLACLSVILGLLFLLPTFLVFFVWPIDVVVSLAWFAAFGLVLYDLDGVSCGNTQGLSDIGECAKWEAAEGFTFLSAFTWLVTGFLGLYLVWRADEHNRRAQENKTYHV